MNTLLKGYIIGMIVMLLASFVVTVITQPITGDMNHDGKLTLTDLSILATKIEQQ